MKTERDYGMEYAEWLLDTGEIEQPEPVDIEEMMTTTGGIPDEDYVLMRREGIDDPDGREYWGGYNKHMLTIKQEG